MKSKIMLILFLKFLTVNYYLVDKRWLRKIIFLQNMVLI